MLLCLLQMRKVKLRELVLLAQGHTAGEWRSWALPSATMPESSVVLCPLPDCPG